MNSVKGQSLVPAIGFIPTYGIRRSFAKIFYYEFIFGVGYRNNILGKNEVCSCSHDEVATDIQANIGYSF